MKKSTTTIAVHPEYSLYQKNDMAFCSSMQVAEEFGKRHDAVLRDIRALDCSQDFYKLNFVETFRSVDMPHGAKRKEPITFMTKDCFMFLVMGYRGQKASVIKENIIKRFNAMEAFIRDYVIGRNEFPIFAQAIADAYDNPQPYHYSNEVNMIYRIVLGMDAKQFRDAHGIEHGKSILPFLSEAQYRAVRKLQAEDIRMLYRGNDYQERKFNLAAKALPAKL